MLYVLVSKVNTRRKKKLRQTSSRQLLHLMCNISLELTVNDSWMHKLLTNGP